MIASPPSTFTGTIREFVEAHVVPNLPPAEALVAWTGALLDYYASQEPTCIVRGQAGGRGAPRKVGKLTVVESDNSPGRWCYLRALDASVHPRDLARVLGAGDLPVLYASSADEQTRWTYGDAMTGRDKQSFSAPQLKHCHIDDALDGAPADLRVRALRNLCPVNHFLWPMPSKFTMRRVGWTELSNRTDLGESQTVIACVQNRLREHLGPGGREVYDRYLRTVGGRMRGPTGDQRIEIFRGSAEVEEPRVIPSTPRPARATPAAPTRLAALAPASGYWFGVLAGGQSNPRSGILAAVPDSAARLDRLRAGMTVEQFVGIANTLFNACDPKDLGLAAPGNGRRQGELAWGSLGEAKRNPRLGGKWSDCVVALRPGDGAGLAALAALDLDGFVTATNRVIGQVYRKV